MIHQILIAVADMEASPIYGQGITVALGGVVTWFVRAWLAELIKEVKIMRFALDENTRVTTIALLEMAALIPGAKPMLEKVKENVTQRMKTGGESS